MFSLCGKERSEWGRGSGGGGEEGWWFCILRPAVNMIIMFNRSTAAVMISLLVLTSPVSLAGGGGRTVFENTPEAVLERYIKALGEGSLAGVRSVYHPSDVDFYLPEPVTISRYVIKGKRVLARTDLAGLELRVPPREGDIQLDVLQVREADGLRTYHVMSYWFRLIDGVWKIYAQSVWGN